MYILEVKRFIYFLIFRRRPVSTEIQCNNFKVDGYQASTLKFKKKVLIWLLRINDTKQTTLSIKVYILWQNIRDRFTLSLFASVVLSIKCSTQCKQASPLLYQRVPPFYSEAVCREVPCSNITSHVIGFFICIRLYPLLKLQLLTIFNLGFGVFDLFWFETLCEWLFICCEEMRVWSYKVCL